MVFAFEVIFVAIQLSSALIFAAERDEAYGLLEPEVFPVIVTAPLVHGEPTVTTSVHTPALVAF